MLQIIEQSSIGKRSPETNEDGIVVSDSYIAVIDGSTNKSHVCHHPQLTGGQYCMKLVSQYIESMPPHLTAQQFCRLITAYIRFIYEQHEAPIDLLTQIPTERMAASAVIYSRQRREVWFIGDCQCLIDGIHHEYPKPYEAALADIRSGYLRLLLMQGKATVADLQRHDSGRDLIMPMLIESCKWQNRSFAVIDGFTIPEEHIHVLPAAEASEIVLASDGYPFLHPTLARSEEALSSQLAADPLCINTFRATKGLMQGYSSFDDRSYIRFRTGGALTPAPQGRETTPED
jgi:glycerophosphoryl diester phosphodiesterase